MPANLQRSNSGCRQVIALLQLQTVNSLGQAIVVLKSPEDHQNYLGTREEGEVQMPLSPLLVRPSWLEATGEPEERSMIWSSHPRCPRHHRRRRRSLRSCCRPSSSSDLV